MKRFISSYQGEATYSIDGVIYRVRTFAIPDSSAVDKATERAEVGTVRVSPSNGSFPSAAVMAEFPGYIGARYDAANNYAVVCNGSAPATFINHLGWLEVKL